MSSSRQLPVSPSPDLITHTEYVLYDLFSAWTQTYKLHAAANSEEHSALTLAFQSNPDSFLELDDFNWSVLHYAALADKSNGWANWLDGAESNITRSGTKLDRIVSEASAHSAQNSIITPLELACGTGNEALVRRLLMSGAGIAR